MFTTSDKCDKFGDYFCSTYVETTIFLPSLWALVPSDARRTNNGPESFRQHFNVQFAPPHHTIFIFSDEIVKQHTLTHITMNDLDNIAPVIAVERKRQQCLFRAWQKFQQQLSSRQQFLRSAGNTAMLCCTIYRRVSETFAADSVVNKDLTFKAKAKDLAFKAKAKVKDLTSRTSSRTAFDRGVFEC